MKHFKQHWSAQPLSVLMSLLMALPVLALFLLAPPRAQGQELARTLPTWAVLDFANPSGYGSTDVGRLAADSFVVELAKLNRYAVLPRQDLLNAINSNNLTPPLNLTSIEKVGQSLGVSAIVAGEIASVSFSQDRRQAKVSIVVRVIDPRSGYLLNGALAEGSSNVRPIPVTDEESLVNEAFGNAAFNAVKQISKFNLPVATVLIGRDVNSVTLNKGSRDGLYNGLSMLVTRNGVVTGTIRVSDVSNNDANAIVTDKGQGIRPEDRATAIFEMPSYSIDKSVGSFRTASSADVASDTPIHKSRSNFFTGIGGILVALIAGALIVSAVNQGHGKSLGGAAVSGPHAVAGRATLVGGAQTSISTVIPVGIQKLGSLYIPVAVRITSDVGNINPNNFLEYHVYRSDAPAALSSPASLGITPTQGTNNNNNNNTNGNNNNNNTGGNNTGSTFSFGQVPLFAQAGHANLAVYDGPYGITSITASKPDITDNTQLLTVTASTLGTTATTTTTGIVVTGQPIPGTGLNLGQRVFYTIEGLYIQPATFSTGTLNPGTNTNGNNNNNNNTNGNNTGVNNNSNNNNTGTNSNNNNTGNNNNNTGNNFGHAQTYQLTSQKNTNYVTLIEPVTPSAGAATGTGLNNVNFTIPATRGGTDYVLEISTDPGFANPKRFAPQPGSYNAPIDNPTNLGVTVSAATGTAVIFNNIDLTTAFPNATQFFYRVGARDLLNGSSEGDNPYIFNDPLPVNLNAGATRAISDFLTNSARERQQKRTRSRY